MTATLTVSAERLTAGSRHFSRILHKSYPTGSAFINTGGGIFDTIGGDMGSLCLQTTLLERVTYAGDGMGVSSFYFKEVV